MGSIKIQVEMRGRDTLSPCHFIEVAERYYSDYVGFALWYYRPT
ncbi:MAG TPA: hypothetical protein VKP66_11850 [Steroidobacteraceae bacterium]|nr:hypothetical protein [Steroidobacteraceae bacterium]